MSSVGDVLCDAPPRCQGGQGLPLGANACPSNAPPVGQTTCQPNVLSAKRPVSQRTDKTLLRTGQLARTELLAC